jgi:hypothetical protein
MIERVANSQHPRARPNVRVEETGERERAAELSWLNSSRLAASQVADPLPGAEPAGGITPPFAHSLRMRPCGFGVRTGEPVSI